MKIITAKDIDSVIDSLDKMTEQQYEAKTEAFAEAQPLLLAYLFHEENFHILSDDEKGYLQYLALITWMAIDQAGESPGIAEEDIIGEAEEKNFTMLEESKASSFRDQLDPFFEGYEQEDLLAFAEEAVLEDEGDPDNMLSKEGRMVVFIALKTIIDVLTGDSEE